LWTNPDSLKKDLQAEANRLGFSLFGVTAPVPAPHFTVFEDWLSVGRHGEMAYLANDRSRFLRADPRRMMTPACRSILVLGMRYPRPAPYKAGRNTGKPGRGLVAAYACGEDYHLVIPPRLSELAARLETIAGRPVTWRSYTDTGAILEHDFAQLAGLGWTAKNTCLISPRQGSYFLLAEVLVDLEIPPDPPFVPDRCGTCTRCMQACPTGCILPNRTLDARRCISYQTIENKGAIPLKMRPLMGNLVFGCDICQQVCPWNHFASAENEPLFDPRPGLPEPVLRQELHLSQADFSQKFKDSPIKRARRAGYLRNVAVAIGNQGDPATLQDLAWTMENEPEALVRAHAAWAIGEIGGSTGDLILTQASRREEEPLVSGEIRLARQQIASQGSHSGSPAS
jgi:epoxyqueuosine reductase